MLRLFVLMILLSSASPPFLWADGGKLQRIREEVRKETEETEEKEKNEGCNHCSCADDGRDGNIWGETFLFITVSPFYLPYAMMQDDLGVYWYFPPHPYFQGKSGYMLRESAEEKERIRPWYGRFSLEESNDFDGINRASIHLLLETTSRLGIQTSWSQVHEELERGSDDLLLGDVNVVFRFAQSEYAQFRAGLGFRLLADSADTDFGFNFTYSADFYPAKPLIISSVIDAGTLGSAGVFHARATIGVNFSRCEIYGGYDYLQIGTLDLQGPVIGLRYWF